MVAPSSVDSRARFDQIVSSTSPSTSSLTRKPKPRVASNQRSTSPGAGWPWADYLARINSPADFQRVRAMRRSWSHPLLVLYVAPNDNLATRLGISVGKRVGNAVVRNQVKRRVREAVRHRYGDLLPGFDLVFIARAPAAMRVVQMRDRARTAIEGGFEAVGVRDGFEGLMAGRFVQLGARALARHDDLALGLSDDEDAPPRHRPHPEEPTMTTRRDRPSVLGRPDMGRRVFGFFLGFGIKANPKPVPSATTWQLRFVDWLEAAGQSWWQVLPLGPPDEHADQRCRSRSDRDRQHRVRERAVSKFSTTSTMKMVRWRRKQQRSPISI